MNVLAYIAAALAEIAGCFAFWAWLKLGKSAWWLLPGIAALCLFAYPLTLVDAEHAGRAYAAYGGVYILSALCWLWAIKGARPERLDGGAWKTRIAVPAPAHGILRWHGDEAAQKAVYANRARLKSAVGRRAMRRRGEMVERSFAHVLNRGGMRRVWLRGREIVHKRHLIHVARFDLGVLMRTLFGCGTPREAAGASRAVLFVLQADATLLLAFIGEFEGKRGMLLIVFTPRDV